MSNRMKSDEFTETLLISTSCASTNLAQSEQTLSPLQKLISVALADTLAPLSATAIFMQIRTTRMRRSLVGRRIVVYPIFLL
jgi:hypothetical protein